MAAVAKMPCDVRGAQTRGDAVTGAAVEALLDADERNRAKRRRHRKTKHRPGHEGNCHKDRLTVSVRTRPRAPTALFREPVKSAFTHE